MSSEVQYRSYIDEERDLPHIIRLVESELSEPYTIYTYRYFLLQWPSISFLAYHPDEPSSPIGVIVCKQDLHRRKERGYIAMLSINPAWRKRGIARKLVQTAIEQMKKDGADEIVLETEEDNKAALSLYASLGFLREKRLFRFYLNGKDAYRLLLPLPPPPSALSPISQSTLTFKSSSMPDSSNVSSSFPDQHAQLDHPSHISAASTSSTQPFPTQGSPPLHAMPPSLPPRHTPSADGPGSAISAIGVGRERGGVDGEGFGNGLRRGNLMDEEGEKEEGDEDWVKARRMMESFTVGI